MTGSTRRADARFADLANRRLTHCRSLLECAPHLDDHYGQNENADGKEVHELQRRRQGRNVKLLFATMADKEWEIMLRVLSTAVDEVIFTGVEMQRSADPQTLAAKLGKRIPHRVISDSRVALQTLLDEADDRDVIVVAGSLYLLGEVRPMLENIAAAKTAGFRGVSR